MVDSTKRCSKCKRILPLSMFHKDKKTSDKLWSYCKDCRNAQSREYCRNILQVPGLPYNENKSCSLYLGVHVAERLLSNVFTNVVRMPMHNKGYDFICGKGFKIDVKSSCLQYDRYIRWKFNICINKIPDYFACIALDDRTHLIPLHFWLIPGNIINNHTTLTIPISQRSLNKWLQYEQSIDNVVSACYVLKSKS